MDIIDFHAHIFPDELASRAVETLKACSPGSQNYTDGTAKCLLQSMKQNGIQKSCNLPVATKPSQVFTINRSCLKFKDSDIIAFGALHPESENIDEEISFMVTNGIPGIKLHPEYQDFYVDDPAYFPTYEKLSDSGLIVVFHAGKDPGPFTCDHSLPASLLKVHREFPQLKMVAAHLGGWKLWEEAENYLHGANIFLDTSAANEFVSPELFSRTVNKHGAENILFGTDSPWCDQGASRKWIESSTISTKEKEMILSLNATRLLCRDAG